MNAPGVYFYLDDSGGFNRFYLYPEDHKCYDNYIEYDLDEVIYDSIYNNKDISCLRKLQVINGNVIDGNETLKNINADEYITVSKECKRQLLEKYGISSYQFQTLIDEGSITTPQKRQSKKRAKKSLRLCLCTFLCPNLSTLQGIPSSAVQSAQKEKLSVVVK